MVDPVTALAAAIGSKELLGKLFGPTAEYVGESAKALVKRAGDKNLADIIQVFSRRVALTLDEPSVVNLRTAKEVLVEGRFLDDPVAKEYFGGLLATARTADGKDDSAVPYLTAVRTLDTRQLRLHYVFYKEFSRLHRGQIVRTAPPTRPPPNTDYMVKYAYLPISVLVSTLGLRATEDPMAVIGHCINGLKRQDLVSPHHLIGSFDEMRQTFTTATEAGVILGPSPFGAELFFSGHGQRLQADALGREDLVLADETGVSIPEGAQALPGLQLPLWSPEFAHSDALFRQAERRR